MSLRCDALTTLLFRLAWTWGFAAVWWHLGTEFLPWSPGPDFGRIGMAVFLFGWGLWNLLTWACSRVTLDRDNGLAWVRRLTWQGIEEREYPLARLRAVVLVEESGPGRYALPPLRLTLRLEDGRMIPLGTIPSVIGVEGHAQALAVMLGCGVEDQREEGRPDPNGTV